MNQGRYSDWKLIGRGGHANVYRAFDNQLQCDVAIKLLNENARQNEGLLAGMRREVLISRQLRHPYICPIHDLFDGPEGIGIVMDLIDGIELADWLKEQKGGGFATTASQRLFLLLCLTRALNQAHQRIVHRDLKPSNVFLLGGEISRPVIMDFGISVIGGAGDGSISGTPKYMAPEQWYAPEKVDARSDLFALGIMAYEIFTGQIPPCSNRDILKTREAVRMSVEDVPPPSTLNPVLPPALDGLVLQMMAYEQADRPQSAQEVLNVLDHVKLRDFTPKASDDNIRQTVEVPGGRYYLGSQPSSPHTNEKPPKRIEIRPFRMDVYPVTNRDYRAYIRVTGRAPSPLVDDPVFGADDHPVVGITWAEADAFAQWAGGALPSEAQWECAARGGERFAEYPWGNEPPGPSHANIDGVRKTTTAVDAHPMGGNPHGIQDLCGNVWEWCADAYEEQRYRSLPNDCVDPVNRGRGEPRVIRGGSYQSFAGMGRCAFRGHAESTERRPDIGFRLVYDKNNVV